MTSIPLEFCCFDKKERERSYYYLTGFCDSAKLLT